MSQPGDTLVLFLLIGAILYFIARGVFPQLKKPAKNEEVQIRGEVPDLLRANGYEVTSAKQKIPLWIEVNEASYESRLYIDYIARLENEWYIVIVERDRKPLRLSGAGLRDFFLSFYLLYHPDGILYVNREKGTIKCVRFDFPDVSLRKPSRLKWTGLFGTILVVILIWLILTVD